MVIFPNFKTSFFLRRWIWKHIQIKESVKYRNVNLDRHGEIQKKVAMILIFL